MSLSHVRMQNLYKEGKYFAKTVKNSVLRRTSYCNSAIKIIQYTLKKISPVFYLLILTLTQQISISLSTEIIPVNLLPCKSFFSFFCLFKTVSISYKISSWSAILKFDKMFTNGNVCGLKLDTSLFGQWCVSRPKTLSLRI